MTKLLFWLILIGGLIGYILFRFRARRPSSAPPTGPKPRTLESVRCRECGVFLPVEKSVQREGEFFCSWEHAQKWHDRVPK